MRLRVVLAGLALGIAPLTGAAAQQDFPQTLYWGSGLIDIPVAWASPLSGDFALNYSAKRFRAVPGMTNVTYSDRMNSQFTLSGSALGRLEGGVAFYSSNPEYGFFLRGVLVTEEDLNLRGGALKWFPALAVGVRNLGKYSHVDRFGLGYEILPRTERIRTRDIRPIRFTSVSIPRQRSTSSPRRVWSSTNSTAWASVSRSGEGTDCSATMAG